MSAKAVDQNRPSTAQIISPGQSTPSYPDGGYFTVKSAPVTINATKDQILTVLLRLSAYHTWNSFIPSVTDIVHPAETTPGSNDSPRDPDLGVVGSSFTFHVRLFSSLPFIKFPAKETITTISKTENVYMVSWRTTQSGAERVHVITEGADGYGTCRYETWDTFQKNFGSVVTRWVFGSALKGGFNEWSADLKRAVEGHNW
ncbi:hypothetical protein TWF106_000186 [Orbilia oligospora]|uniref:Coenzyme Q-binding protein COQ10 START domain-containing protein n=1 Tax=Orbilia oligospora TaxID=2813651 RepID=A0A6G1MLF9_ORBOL|nr:hypothetical protein TWF788_008100 [Orbilia oligospora]KAF3221750.1 hypothetical protein TWF679_006963 [Orbilia oligospora]KAF3229660.1 hypothetical protein TWF106_000047 [Orbilia oligospora]KAF3229797.1 hypothetical protein TWF106_000186 [Orbilia oligospora]KAF3230104.1 hypothetical protein TWF191_000345 [Orbilia oligospora]